MGFPLKSFKLRIIKSTHLSFLNVFVVLSPQLSWSDGDLFMILLSNDLPKAT